MEPGIIAIAGGSGFIGRAIARRLAAIEGVTVRVLSRNPDAARSRFSDLAGAQFVRADVGNISGLTQALENARAVVNAVQFDGFPVENPSRGLTFDKVDYGGTVAMLAAAKRAGVAQFIYISGAGADESSSHPAFRAKGRAERAIRESELDYTILRPSIVYGPEDRVLNSLARILRFAPVFVVPGSGKQKLQPVLVDDVAACVVLALSGRGRNGTYEIGGPEPVTFDEMVRTIMEVTGRRRPMIHFPESLARAGAGVAEMLPRPPITRDALAFVSADSTCDIVPLIAEFGIQLTPLRIGLGYLARRA
jgi:uncharacterized protein YbjT (DUF2867 family)